MLSPSAASLALILFIVMLPDRGAASNPDYRCEVGTVQNDAFVSAYSDVDVASYSKPADRVCIFAVGGAGSSQAYSSISHSPISEILRRAVIGDIFPLAERVVVASPPERDDIEMVVEAIASLLAASINDFNIRISTLHTDPAEVSSDQHASEHGVIVILRGENDVLMVECGIAPPPGGSLIRSEVPVLRIFARSHNGISNTLFIPRGATE